MSRSLRLLLDQGHEVDGVQVVQPAFLADGVERRLQEVGVVDARDLDRVLEGHEHALAGALVGGHLEQVLAAVEDAAAGDLVAGVAGQGPGQGALARPVGSHDGVHLARIHFETHSAEDLFVLRLHLQILNAE